MLKPVEVRGTRTPVKQRPATFDIPARALAALRHMAENADPHHSYVPYVGATLGEREPHFVHHRLDWTEVLPYSIYGMVMARDITGTGDGVEVQREQRKLYLSAFDEMDGLIHAPRSPWSDPYPMCLWEQARALYALLYWHMDDPDDRLLEMIDRLVDELFALSHQEGRMRVFPVEIIRNIGMQYYAVGSLIDPLVKVYELTGNVRALQIAEGLVHYMLEPRNGFFAEDGRFVSWYRSVVSVINGLSRFAALTGDPRVLDRARTIHDHAISLATRYGSTPCIEPACSNMELNMSAFALIRAGHDEYWDQIDRFARNQTAEAQFLDPAEWVERKARKGRIDDKEQWVYEGRPQDIARLPFDDYDNVVERCVGGFVWTSADEHLFIPGALMLCCGAHGVRTFHLMWKEAVSEEITGLRVNLHVSCENPLAEVISFEPFEGKTVIIPKKDAALHVRVPEYARGAAIDATADGKPIPVRVTGRYAALGQAKAGSEYTVRYPLEERDTEETQYYFKNRELSVLERTVRLTAHWVGNTVTSLSPVPDEEKRIYRRDAMRPGRAPTHDISYFVSDKDIRW